MRFCDRPFVVVEWDDAWKSATDDVDLAGAEAAHVPTRAFTAGWLLVDDEKGIQLGAEVSPAEPLPYRQRSMIPRAMIIAVHPVVLSKPRVRKYETTGDGNRLDAPDPST